MLAAREIEIDHWPQTADAFAPLIEATQDELIHFAFYRLGNRTDAEDIVQDAYLQAFRDRHKLHHITAVRAYLFRMVGNRCTDRLRTRSRECGAVQVETGELPFSDAALEASDIARLLMQLPEREAEVIRLRAWSDLSFADVAQAVGASVPTVKSRFRYGVQKLRKLLGSGRNER